MPNEYIETLMEKMEGDLVSIIVSGGTFQFLPPPVLKRVLYRLYHRNVDLPQVLSIIGFGTGQKTLYIETSITEVGAQIEIRIDDLPLLTFEEIIKQELSPIKQAKDILDGE